MSRLFIGELIGTSLRDGHHMVHDVRQWVQVGQRVVDLAFTYATRWLRPGDRLAVAVADRGTAWVTHNPARPTMSNTASSSILSPSRGLAARTWPVSSSRSRADQHTASSGSVVLGSSSRSMLASRCLLPATAPVSMRHAGRHPSRRSSAGHRGVGGPVRFLVCVRSVAGESWCRPERPTWRGRQGARRPDMAEAQPSGRASGDSQGHGTSTYAKAR